MRFLLKLLNRLINLVQESHKYRLLVFAMIITRRIFFDLDYILAVKKYLHYFILSIPPYEFATESSLFQWNIQKHGIFYSARFGVD